MNSNQKKNFINKELWMLKKLYNVKITVQDYLFFMDNKDLNTNEILFLIQIFYEDQINLNEEKSLLGKRKK